MYTDRSEHLTVMLHREVANAKTLDMRDEHWQLMEDLQPILQPLQVVISLLPTESMPLSSTVYQLVSKLKAEVLVEKPDVLSAMQSFKMDTGMRKALTELFRLPPKTARDPHQRDMVANF